MHIIDYIKGHRDQLSPTQEVKDPVLDEHGIRLLMKRDDLIHEHISGNKWRKLRYNLKAALQGGHHTILTFGGAFSNHIAATAHACYRAGLHGIGIVRGEDDRENPTLNFARKQGMELHFVSRSEYRRKTNHQFKAGLKEKFGRFYLVPEGGANAEGVRGCTEILPEVKEHFDVVCCAAGTGTTLAGLALTLKEDQRLIGFPALKGGEFLTDDVRKLMDGSGIRPPSTVDVGLSTDYHFGGFARMNPRLLEFIHGLQEGTGIPLDPVYTGKMMFGIYDMIGKGKFDKGVTILAIHTGGLQGWQGMSYRKQV